MHLLSFHRRIVSAGLLLMVIDWIFENCYSVHKFLYFVNTLNGKILRQHRTNEVPVTGTISPRYIHQFSHKSIRVIAKGSAVLPSGSQQSLFSSNKVIFQHPQAIRAIRHIRIARTPRLLSFCYQTGNPVLKKYVFSRLFSLSSIIPTQYSPAAWSSRPARRGSHAALRSQSLRKSCARRRTGCAPSRRS